MICFFTLKFWIDASRKGDEYRDWKHSTSSCRQKPLSRLIFKRRTDADVNQRWLTGQGHFRGQSDFNWGRCPSGPTPRSAPAFNAVSMFHAFEHVSQCFVLLCYFEHILHAACSPVPHQLPGKLSCRSNHVFVPKAKRLRNAGTPVIDDCQWECKGRDWCETGEDGGEWKQRISIACMCGWNVCKR